MSKYTGKAATIVVGGTTLDNIETTVNDEAVMEDSVDTASPTMTIGSNVLVVDEQEPVAIALTGSTTAFHKTTVAIRSSPPNIKGGAEVTITFNERSAKQWAGITAVITRVSMAFGAKKLTRFTFDWRAKTAWTYPAS